MASVSWNPYVKIQQVYKYRGGYKSWVGLRLEIIIQYLHFLFGLWMAYPRYCPPPTQHSMVWGWFDF
jgi:hypothetical protein